LSIILPQFFSAIMAEYIMVRSNIKIKKPLSLESGF